jgi:3-deoxy-D-manno-octulosonate 8-phosphate phosphatase (KDO 8-P phosphatase)
VNDTNAFAKAGLAACPSDAVESIRQAAHYVCNQKGGDGAVREVIDLILTHKNLGI